MSASKPSYELKNQVADLNFFLAINRSARESHYSDRRIFCNYYLMLFSDQIQSQKNLSQERILSLKQFNANNSVS